MSAVRTVLVLALGGLCACEGSPGEARLQLYDPASAEPGWEQTVPSQWFSLEEGAPEGQLRVAATDYCWTDTLLLDFELATGRLLGEQRRGAYAITGGPPWLDPPTACASGFAAQRLTLSSGELVDLCSHSEDGSLAVSNVASRSERFRLRLENYASAQVAGDQLLLRDALTAAISSYSLLSGEPLWSWTAPDEYTIVAGADAERLYVLSETTAETHALALADGSVVWQKNLGCDALSLAGDVLVCRQALRDSTCEQE